jgi:hypothetical protein
MFRNIQDVVARSFAADQGGGAVDGDISAGKAIDQRRSRVRRDRAPRCEFREYIRDTIFAVGREGM